MVDPERLHRLLRRISGDLAVLKVYAGEPRDKLAGSPAELGHIKYLFVTAIEGCIDAAHHLSASEGYEVADTNADTMKVLARHGVLDAGLADHLAAAVRFRNVLVHRYADVDDTRVLAHLDHLDSLDRFVSALAGLLDD